MPRGPKNNGNSKRLATQQSVDQAVKSIVPLAQGMSPVRPVQVVQLVRPVFPTMKCQITVRSHFLRTCTGTMLD